MENTEVRHSFLPLLADVAVKDRDFKGVREQVGCTVPVDHQVGGYLIHRGHGTDPAAIGAVAPDGMILSVRMYPDGEHHDCRAQEHQHVRQQIQHRGGITCQQGRAMEVERNCQGNKLHRQQQPGGMPPGSGNQLHIQEGESSQGNPEQPGNQMIGYVP